MIPNVPGSQGFWLNRFCSSVFVLTVRTVGFLDDHASTFGPRDGTQKYKNVRSKIKFREKLGPMHPLGGVRLHVRRQRSLGCRQCLNRNINECSHTVKSHQSLERPILGQHLPMTELLTLHVCHHFACPVMPWVLPFS